MRRSLCVLLLDIPPASRQPLSDDADTCLCCFAGSVLSESKLPSGQALSDLRSAPLHTKPLPIPLQPPPLPRTGLSLSARPQHTTYDDDDDNVETLQGTRITLQDHLTHGDDWAYAAAAAPRERSIFEACSALRLTHQATANQLRGSQLKADLAAAAAEAAAGRLIVADLVATAIKNVIQRAAAAPACTAALALEVSRVGWHCKGMEKTV
jgi:hypothetical protein